MIETYFDDLNVKFKICGPFLGGLDKDVDSKPQ